MEKTVHLLVHRHHLAEESQVTTDFMEDGEPLFWDDRDDSYMVMGLYSSRALAEQRIESALRLPGFNLAPDGFSIHEYTLDSEHSTKGFRVKTGGE
ncbi:hypothetical protein ACFU53_30140 [Streptomyces sp. NPDC057474]|uniref:hypothetical protein n=1 Tax=Streptomyces sp. NPDC057474 TaxID=3346144 RepID=UPI0036B93F22